MIYFKYKISFKKAKNLDNLLKNQNIMKILSEDDFKKRQLNGDDIYCFVDPYCWAIDHEIVLNWEETEQEAIDTFHRSAEDV